jgi:deoxyribodipyrimidine photolyase
MAPPDMGIEKKKLQELEQELNDLRQGLTVVTDYSRDLRNITKHQDASAVLDESIVKPLIEDDLEFESIWRFHEEVLVADPSARVSCPEMYQAFTRYCTQSGRTVVDQDAFEFVFVHMENPQPGLDRGAWTGYRLRISPG